MINYVDSKGINIFNEQVVQSWVNQQHINTSTLYLLKITAAQLDLFL